MKGIDVASRVRTIAGDENSLIYTDSVIVNWINDAMRECVVDNMLLQKTGTVPTVIGQNEYDLPTDVLKLYSIRYDNGKLPVYTLEEFDELVSTDGSDRGDPVAALIWAGKIRLWPVPDKVKDLKIEYSYSPTLFTVNDYDENEIPLPVLYHRRIVDYCLAMVAEQDDDMNRYQIKMDEFRSGVQNLKDHGESTHDLYPMISVESRDMADGWWD